MGLFEWVKSQTGVWGPALLGLYSQHAWWINSLVVAYGFVLVLSWLNLSRMLDDLVDQIVEQASKRVRAAKSDRDPETVRLSDFHLSWERAAATSRFPLVAKRSAVSVHRSSVETLRELISERDLFQRCSRRLKSLGLDLEMVH